MPVVPQYQPQVRPQGLPDVRVDAPDNNFGALAKGLQDVSTVFNQVVAEGADRDRKVRLLGYSDQLDAKYLARFNGPGGAFSKKGAETFDLDQTVMPEFLKDIDGIAETITDPDEKIAFMGMARSSKENAINGIAALQVREREAYNLGQAGATKESAQATAAANVTDPNVIHQSLAKAELASDIENQGRSESEIAVDRAKARGGVHTAVMLTMIEKGKAGDAVTYMGGLTELDKQQIPKAALNAVETASNQGRGRAAAEEIWKASGGGKSDVLKLLSKIENKEVRDFAKSEVTAMLTISRAAKSEREESLKDRFWTLAVKKVPLSKMPPDLVNAVMNEIPEVYKQVESYQADGGGVDKTAVAIKYGELAMLNDAQLAQLNPVDLIPSLGTGSEYEKWADRIKEAKKGGPSGYSRALMKEQFEFLAPRLLFPGGDSKKGESVLSDEQAERLGSLWMTVDREVELAQASGQKLDTEGREKIIERVVMNDWRKNYKLEVNRGGFRDEDVALDKLVPEDVTKRGARIEYSSIPAPSVKTMTAAIRQLQVERGKQFEISEDVIAAYFTAYLAGGGADNPESAFDFADNFLMANRRLIGRK